MAIWHKIKQQIPNTITLLNLLSGSAAIFFALDNRLMLVQAGWLIVLAAVFDFFDGFTARALNAKTKVGVYLDSLADMVSFGVAPAAIMFQLMKSSMHIKRITLDLPLTDLLILFSSTLIILFAAIRLARFTADSEKQKENFEGLASPANALIVASIPFMLEFNPDKLLLFSGFLGDNIYFFLAIIFLQVKLLKIYVLLPIVLLVSFMMIMRLKLFSLKISSFSWKENKIKFTFLIISTFLFLVFQSLSTPLILILYVGFSIFNNYVDKKNQQIVDQNLSRVFGKD